MACKFAFSFLDVLLCFTVYLNVVAIRFPERYATEFLKRNVMYVP